MRIEREQAQEKPTHQFASRLWKRLSDRKKWPRNWWYPVPEHQVFSSVEAWQRQHDEVSKTMGNWSATGGWLTEQSELDEGTLN